MAKLNDNSVNPIFNSQLPCVDYPQENQLLFVSILQQVMELSQVVGQI